MVGHPSLTRLWKSRPSYARSFRQRFLLIRRTLTGGAKSPGCQRRQACVWIVFALLNGILTCLGRRQRNNFVSNLVRNVPLFTSLEVSPLFALLLSFGPP